MNPAGQQVEKALRESEVRYRSIIDTAVDGVITIDSNGVVDLFNAAAERIFGYRAGEVLGRNVSMLMPSPARDEHDQYLRRYLQTGECKIIGIGREAIGRRKDGSLVPIELAVSEFSLDDRRMFTGIVRDVTERKRAREALERSNREMAAAIRELESFAHSVSHDLRQPLRGIAGFSRMLVEDHARSLAPEARAILDAIVEQAERMGRLIDDLLLLSRVARQALVPQRVDLSSLAGAILDALRREEPSRRVAAIVAEGLAATGDPGLLRIALENLIANAWKFTGTRVEARIEIGGLSEGGERVLFVRDNGVGFDMRYAHKLFGAFQRLHPQSEFPGTGIGLATVQRIAQRHGGRVWAQAQPGQGASFFFTLPGME